MGVLFASFEVTLRARCVRSAPTRTLLVEARNRNAARRAAERIHLGDVVVAVRAVPDAPRPPLRAAPEPHVAGINRRDLARLARDSR